MTTGQVDDSKMVKIDITFMILIVPKDHIISQYYLNSY